MKRRSTVVGLIGLLLCGALWLTAEAKDKKGKDVDLSGTWNVEGWNMGEPAEGKPSFTCKAEVEAKGNDTYLVSWVLANGAVNPGVGIYDPEAKVFAAGYGISGSPGVAIYHISKDGKTMECSGTFRKMAGQVAHEKWTR